MLPYVQALFLLLQRQPAYYLEAPDATRDMRLQMVAAELSQYPRSVSVALAYQGHRESGWALYVWRGCIPAEIPKGAPSCDKGHARGYWQEWENTCRDAYRYQPGTAESLHEEVQCAARIWRSSLQRCRGRNDAGDIAGAFAGFSAVGCAWQGGKARASEYDATLTRFLRLRNGAG
jgi:hypothetical protein